MFKTLAQKISGEQIENLVVGLHDARQMLHDTLDAVKRYEVLVAGQVASERTGNKQFAYPNEDVRKAEVARRLEHNSEYQSLKEKLQDARVNLALAEAELEREKANHAGLIALTGFLTAMVNTGQINDRKNIEAAVAEILRDKVKVNHSVQTVNNSIKNENYEKSNHASARFPAKALTQQQATVAGDTGVELGAFMVLEVRETRNGAMRGYCQDAKGNKVAIYATNGLRQTLAQAEGCFIQATYTQGDKGLIAKSIKLVS